MNWRDSRLSLKLWVDFYYWQCSFGYDQDLGWRISSFEERRSRKSESIVWEDYVNTVLTKGHGWQSLTGNDSSVGAKIFEKGTERPESW